MTVDKLRYAQHLMAEQPRQLDELAGIVAQVVEHEGVAQGVGGHAKALEADTPGKGGNDRLGRADRQGGVPAA